MSLHIAQTFSKKSAHYLRLYHTNFMDSSKTVSWRIFRSRNTAAILLMSIEGNGQRQNSASLQHQGARGYENNAFYFRFAFFVLSDIKNATC
jgi:hypothetical protein